MAEERAAEPPADSRVSTGTSGLDTMLLGGLVARRPYLIVGPSGTGKTTLALQFLIEGVRQGERALFVTMEEPPNEVRINHRLLGPELLKVEVFDAIPDIMRYERVPFKDIAAVRQALPFGRVPLEIRRSPELTAVEVTMTGLEQMLRSEVQRRTYSRIVIDSLTALQYFCMKGFEPVAGAQAFLRFLSDLRVTTVLTVESPLEDADTPERMLARGEIRLFRWELEGRTVRAVGVEKFRGSSHDVRLHPYRIGPHGVEVNLEVTISRDTRQIIEPPRPLEAPPPAVAPAPAEEAVSLLDPLVEEVRDLVLVGADVAPLRTELEAALRATSAGDLRVARGRLSRANALLIGLGDSLRERAKEAPRTGTEVAEAWQRVVERSEAARAGMPPTNLPAPRLLEVQLEWVLSLLPAPAPVPTAPPAPPLEWTIATAAEVPDAGEAPEIPTVPSAGATLPVEGPGIGGEEAETVSNVLAPASARPPVPIEPEVPFDTTVAPGPEPPTGAPLGTTPVDTVSVVEPGPAAPVPASAEPESAPTGSTEGTEVIEVLDHLPGATEEPVVATPAVPAPEPVPSVERVSAVPTEASLPPEAGPAPETGPVIEATTPLEPAPPAPTAEAPAVAPPTGLPPPSAPPLPTPAPTEPRPGPPTLKEWVPPALPPSPPAPGPRVVPSPSSAGPSIERIGPAVRGSGPRDHRPPLPVTVREFHSPPEPRTPSGAPAETTRPPPAFAPIVPPTPDRTPPVEHAGVPSGGAAGTGAPPLTAPRSSPPAKKKRKAPSPRKRGAAVSLTAPTAGAPLAVPAGESLLPEGAGSVLGSPPTGSVPSAPKRRPTRKRKAPRVVAAHPGPTPAKEEPPAPAPTPPPETGPPPPPPAEASPPPEEKS